MPNSDARGPLYAAIAYGTWGFFPLYWKLLKHVSPGEVIAQRVVWSFAFLAVIVRVRQRGPALAALWQQKTVIVALATSTVLIGANWYLYIWAVVNQHVLDASLGYFLTPLVNVLLGLLFLGERLSRVQKVAVGCGAAGVALLTFGQATFPWIALSLAASFGLYGLIRKRTPVDSLLGLTVETALLGGPALLLLGWLATHGQLAFGHAGAKTTGLLALAGVVTAIPLLSFAAAARRMPLSTLSFYQYLAPTIQFLLATLFYQEPFDLHLLTAFAFIWAGLAVFSLNGVWRARALATKSAEPPALS